jgi:NADPH:quinone reductase-like Zn-dependent oxidoreductase
MRAFAIDRFGGPGSVRELPTPEAGAGEVLVRVRAAGVNAVDPWVVGGAYKEMMEHRFPLIPGVEASGVVEAVGDAVNGFAEGDHIYGVSDKPFYGAGTFAEMTTLPAGGIGPKPASVDHISAAALPHTALTALAAVEAVEPKGGEVILVVGSTGGVGSYVTQLAAKRGARVVAVARAENAEYARSLGAVETVDYTSGDLAELVRSEHPGGVDAIIDLFGDGPTLTRLSELVRTGGHVVSTGGAADPEVLSQRGLRGLNVNRASPERLAEVTRLVGGDELKVPPTRVFPLEEAAAALAEMGGRHVRGKLILRVGE